MIDTLPPQLPEEIAAERRRREEAASERWPMIVGLAGTVLIHLLAVVMIREIPESVEVPVEDVADLRAKYDKQELTLMLADETPPPQPKRFVEVNPDAPENDPGKTDSFGARNQQSAQPEPGKDHNDRPMTKGEVEDSTAIVTGSHERAYESLPAAGANGQNGTGMQAVVIGATAQPKAEAPLPGFEKITGDNPEGLGTAIGTTPGDKPDIDKKTEGKADGTEKALLSVATNGGGVPGSPGRPAPRPRPKLQNVRPAVLANQPLSTDNVGVIGVDAKFSEFGDYLQELVETIDAQWHKLVDHMTTYPPSRSVVTVHFKLNSQGDISQIIEVLGEDKAGRIATYICLDAIRARAPYRPWTKEMVAVLGTEQEITFGFYYW
jgi:hypothetical protein